MKRWIALLLCVMLLAGCACASAAAKWQVGSTVQDFEVELCDGSRVSLSGLLADYGIVAVNIWGTWCPWCLREFPYMDEALKQFSGRVAVLCLSNSDSSRDIAAFQAQHGYSMLMAHDGQNLSGAIAWEGYYPVTAIVDRSMKCVYLEAGAMTSTADFTALFQKYLPEEAAPADTGHITRPHL